MGLKANPSLSRAASAGWVYEYGMIGQEGSKPWSQFSNERSLFRG